MGVRVFWLERSEFVEVALRRFTTDGCPAGKYGHTARTVIEAAAARATWIEDLPDDCHRTRAELVAMDDARWPTACAACGTAFDGTAHHQVHGEPLYRGAPDGQLYTLVTAPVGAMWDAWWMRHGELKDNPWTGPDGLTLIVKTPGGDWMVDAEASNCTRPQRVPVEGNPGCHRFVRSHYCWVRHGDPRTGTLHVDKNGETCSAGAGSIIAGAWHGFLHNSELTP